MCWLDAANAKTEEEKLAIFAEIAAANRERERNMPEHLRRMRDEAFPQQDEESEHESFWDNINKRAVTELTAEQLEAELQ